MALYRGVGVALVTLFDADGRLDVAATAHLAGRLADLGVRAVLVAGTTGEAATLEPAERVALVRAVRAALPAYVPVIAGTGAATGPQSAALSVAALDAGADAVLALSPPRVDDPRAYYDSVAKAVAGRPLLAYHFPDASAPGISVDALAELPVDGLKDSSGDAERLVRELDVLPGDLYVGAAPLALVAGALGAAGVLLAVANVDPERCAAAFAGDGTAQRELLATHVMAAADFPYGLKRLVHERFGTSTAGRLGR